MDFCLRSISTKNRCITQVVFKSSVCRMRRTQLLRNTWPSFLLLTREIVRHTMTKIRFKNLRNLIWYCLTVDFLPRLCSDKRPSIAFPDGFVRTKIRSGRLKCSTMTVWIWRSLVVRPTTAWSEEIKACESLPHWLVATTLEWAMVKPFVCCPAMPKLVRQSISIRFFS